MRIRRTPLRVWRSVRDALTRADNIEEGHYMERSWAAMLSDPLPDATEEALLCHARARSPAAKVRLGYKGLISDAAPPKRKASLIIDAAPPKAQRRALSTCTNTCNYAADGECDDGGPGAEFLDCSLGTGDASLGTDLRACTSHASHYCVPAPARAHTPL